MKTATLYLVLLLQLVGQSFPAGVVLCRPADGAIQVEPEAFRTTVVGRSESHCAGWCAEGKTTSGCVGCPDQALASHDPHPAFHAPSPLDHDTCSDLALSPGRALATAADGATVPGQTGSCCPFSTTVANLFGYGDFLLAGASPPVVPAPLFPGLASVSPLRI